MARLSRVQRIIVEDFPSEDQELVSKLAYVLNNFMEQVTREFNGNIDYENLEQDIVEYVVTVDASGVPTGNNLIKSSVSNPGGVEIIRAVNQTSSTTYPTSAPWISYTANGNLVKVKKITGLQADNKYTLTVRVTP